MPSSPMPQFDAVLRRMFHRDGVDTLTAHLEQTHRIAVAKTTELDVGVFKNDQVSGAALVARLFSAARPLGRRAGRPRRPTSSGRTQLSCRATDDGQPADTSGQAVLVTEFVKSAAKAKQPLEVLVDDLRIDVPRL